MQGQRLTWQGTLSRRGQPLTTTLPPEDHAYIEGLANALGRSVSSVLAEIVRAHIEAEERRLTPKRKRK